ncbi:1,3-propanediol dehydrogenase [Sporobacter termitidis DSM 10068]|uniref:1,3-propanediol dehydrogenase n=1 Tax=Sporobacter termitidis DSM 10068 TaxID=1123282 RepID=A0A1M5ZCI1_9FIRM|nr:iron-containing alcohol dehydrogenase [Sporobacter termitidis]SHI21663.1 1,3-propanediol dehydrogenase [Sporobacter termitidis DSM 10068]
MFSTWNSPNPVLYGSGSSKAVGAQLKKLGCKKVVVVCDAGVKAAGIAGKILGYIQAAGIETVLFDGVLPDSPDVTINEGGALAAGEKVDGVVAVGGGSSIDTGKGIDVLLSNPPPINRYFARPGQPPTGDLSRLKPIVVIPTTAGTGSEVTPGGACADTAANTKENFGCPVTLGIIDPELTLELPPAVTAATAFDALCHAVEAVVSNQPNEFSQLFGFEAIRLIGENLPEAVRDGGDLKAREGLQLAATMASMSILGPFCNIPHDIGAVICMRFRMPHGVAVSACLPEIFKFYAPAVPDKMKKITEALGGAVPEAAAPEEIGRIASETIFELMKNSGLPRLTDYVASKAELLSAVRPIMATQNFFFSPRPVTPDDIADILGKSYDAQLRLRALMEV